MKVRTGATKNGRVIDIELDSDDGEHTFHDWKILTTAEKFKRLSAEADKLLVYYLAREHIISSDYAHQRVKEIRESV